jgi:hypothetical protein
MSDNLNLPGPPDSHRISLSQQHEVSYWTKKFGVTKDVLAAAIKECGSDYAIKVAKHLKKSYP